MRERKFRIYDTENKEYVRNSRKLYLNPNGCLYEMDIEDRKIYPIYNTDNYIIEDFTGYKDMDGVEIYENDAIKEGVEHLFTDEEIKNTVGLENITPETNGYKNYLWHGNIGRGITKKQSDSWEYQYSSYKTAKDSYSSIWDIKNAKRGYSWESNPYVWVIEFKKK